MEVVPTTEWPYRDRVPKTSMEVGEVTRLLGLLVSSGIEFWVDGGWGVDALMRRCASTTTSTSSRFAVRCRS